MAIRFLASRGVVAATRGVRPTVAVQRTFIVTTSTPRHFRCSAVLRNAADRKESHSPTEGDPIADSMKDSAAPSGENTSAISPEEVDDATRNKHAAFLGEADSDDGFEAHQETYPEHHRHHFSNVDASGIHGQAGEGDEPIESQRKPVEHRIHETSQAAYLGESDSDDAHELDQVVNPERYRHRIDDPSSSGMHGESGHDDAPFERDRK